MTETAPAPLDALRGRIRENLRVDETEIVNLLCEKARFSDAQRAAIIERARPLVQSVRDHRLKSGGIDAFLNTYDLSSREGIVLMCIAEALLRIPDSETVDRLIRDKIGSTEWEKRLGASHSLFVNASTWGLMLTGKIVNLAQEDEGFAATLKRLVARTGEPFIRQAVVTAMRILGRQFVMGRTIQEALDRAKSDEKQGYRHSYDMLGEAARTARDALYYFESYTNAIAAIGRAAAETGLPAVEAPSISIKLSALHPRYEVAQEDRVHAELFPAVRALALQAKTLNIGFTIDAEEVDRLEMSLDLVAALAHDPELAGWEGLGLAVQAYSKRTLPMIEWLAAMSRHANRRLMIRLVKGAYWDAEIKMAQERGLSGYPVFTRKASTDVSYLACAKAMFANIDAVYPAFATHNAHTVAAVAEIAGNAGDWEFQRLHGMGDDLYAEVVPASKWNRPCRVYAPVGTHEDLLAYLVRRLLENGANTSFVNRIADADLPLETLLADPVETTLATAVKPHPRIPLPDDLYASSSAARRNSQGIDMHDKPSLAALKEAIAASAANIAHPVIAGRPRPGREEPVTSPADRTQVVGAVVNATARDVAEAMASARSAHQGWEATPAGQRATLLEKAADLLQQHMPGLLALIVREGGRTQGDALSEVREGIDFLRYYAAQCREKFSAPTLLPGPTGERNTLSLGGRGVFVCISPWNFPVAIFTGQIAAALAAGNCVVAKPAEQTPLCGAMVVRLMHQAGIPGDVLHFLPGDGRIGAAMVEDSRCAGVAFTGSTEVARIIAQSLAARPGPIVPLIAETGGQNALIADSSSLPEQVVRDVVLSAFNSAGQRCSALRVLFIQSDIADKVIAMLKGAMQELVVGDPGALRTDVGPVIDEEARQALLAHTARMDGVAKLIHVCDLDASAGSHGTFFAPRAYEIDSLDRLEREVFGPILHIVRWKADELDQVCDAIAATGYGLTLGIHSRIDETVNRIVGRLHVGNTYVNRNIVGAVVGVQPFGGEGLSGTGPKAGGPHYLYRFAVERSLSIDTTAAGGNASLMSLDEA